MSRKVNFLQCRIIDFPKEKCEYTDQEISQPANLKSSKSSACNSNARAHEKTNDRVLGHKGLSDDKATKNIQTNYEKLFIFGNSSCSGVWINGIEKKQETQVHETQHPSTAIHQNLSSESLGNLQDDVESQQAMKSKKRLVRYIKQEVRSA